MVSVVEQDNAMAPAPSKNVGAAIHVARVTVSYPAGKAGRKTILDEIELEIAQGEFVVILGETGCGKSTMLRMILGQERPTAGKITVAGHKVERVSAACGYVPQKYSLFPDRTVLSNLTMGPETAGYH